MRLLHYTATYAPAWSWGGPPRSVSNLCEGLAALGHEVSVFTTNAGLEHDVAITVGRPVERNGVHVTYYPARRGVLGIVSTELEAAVKQNAARFDLIHLCGAWQPTSPAAVSVARRAGIPYVVSPRGMLQRYSFSQKPWKKWLWYYLRERGQLRHAAAIHCTSRLEDREMARLHLPAPRFIVPNVIPTTMWRRDTVAGSRFRTELGLGSDDLLLLYAGRLHHKKGLELLPAVCAELSRRRPVRLVLAGPDEDGTQGRLVQDFNTRGLAGCVRFLGKVGTSELVAAYSAAQVFVFPSRDENFGNVAVEALACGCPVVLGRGVGAAEDLADLAAVRVAELEPVAWAEAIGSLTANCGTLPEYDRLRTLIEQRFGMAGVARTMSDHYTRLC